MGKKKEDINTEAQENKVNTEEQEKTEPVEEETKDKGSEELSKLQEALAAQKDSYLRLAAEYDNYRKRTQAEKLSIYDDATAKAVEQLLPVADSLDMAVMNMGEVPEEFKKGLELVKNQLATSLGKLKVEVFGEIGEEFNPEIHNAISTTENGDLGKNTISQVFQKGYKIGNRVIRHAMVQVANCD